jgi:GDP-mannose pyrophosphatase NudK
VSGSRFDRVRIVIARTSLLWQGFSTLKQVVFDYHKDGETAYRLTWEVYDRGEAVAALLFNRDHRTVVLVRQFRIPVHLGGDPAFLLEVPAGSLEREDPAEAAHREIVEETGYRPAVLQRIFSAYTSPGSFTEKMHFFFAAVSDADRIAEGGGLAEEHEDIEISEVPLEEALAMVDNGDICDAKTILLLQWAALNRAALG